VVPGGVDEVPVHVDRSFDQPRRPRAPPGCSADGDGDRSCGAVDPTRSGRPRAPIKEGKSRREIVPCLKRYVAREVFHLVGQLQPGPRS
jgi:hypothetical protein